MRPELRNRMKKVAWILGTITFAIIILAISQLLVQSYCFLRLNTRSENTWNTMPFLFTIFIIAVLVGGSVWIMYNLNYNMFH